MNDLREFERKLSRQINGLVPPAKLLAKHSQVSGVGAKAHIFLAASQYRQS